MISTFMTMVNEFYKKQRINKSEFKTFLQLLNPFAPHISEELFEIIGEKVPISSTSWPIYENDKTIDQEIELPVQINGKLKATVIVPLDAEEIIVKEIVHNNEIIKNILANQNIIKEIYVKNKIYNIVVK